MRFRLPFKDPIERLLYITLAVFMLIILLSGIGVYVRLHDQQQIIQNIQTQSVLTREHTDCVALLLTKPGPNRGALRIQDLNNCKVGP